MARTIEDRLLKSCCYYFSLRRGTLFIGYPFAIIFGLLMVAGLVCAIVAGIQIHYGLTWHRGQPDHKDVLVLALSIAVSIAAGLVFVFSVALLVGVHQKKPDYVSAWTMCALGLNFLVFFGGFCSSISFQAPVYLIPTFFILAVGFYLWIVVRSFYFQLKDEVGRTLPTEQTTEPMVLFSNTVNFEELPLPSPSSQYPNIKISSPRPPEYKDAVFNRR